MKLYNMNPVEKFIGPKKIFAVEVTPDVSFLGTKVLKVHYEGGGHEFVTETVLDLIVTSTPSDFTSVRDISFKEAKKKMFPLLGAYIATLGEPVPEGDTSRQVLITKLVEIVAEYSIKERDIDPLFDSISSTVQKIYTDTGETIGENYNRIINYFLTGDLSTYIPGTNPLSEVTFLEIKKSLEKVAEADAAKKNN